MMPSPSEQRAMLLTYQGLDIAARNDAIMHRPLIEKLLPELRTIDDRLFAVLHRPLYQKTKAIAVAAKWGRRILYGVLVYMGAAMIAHLANGTWNNVVLVVAIIAGGLLVGIHFGRRQLIERLSAMHADALRKTISTWSLSAESEPVSATAGAFDEGDMFDVPPQSGSRL